LLLHEYKKISEPEKTWMAIIVNLYGEKHY